MINNLNFTNFDSFLSNKLVLVEYGADWCQSCKAQEIIIKEIDLEIGHLIKMAHIDISDNRFISDQQKVKNIPSLILYRNGQELERFSGLTSKNIIIQRIQKHQSI